MTDTYTSLVAAHGLSESHRAVLAAVPQRARVLDVGCAGGYLGTHLHGRGCALVGIEPDPEAAAAARAGPYETVIEGDIENADVRETLAGPFDVVMFADVLEHLRDPWGTLAHARELLAPGGRAIVSLPNIAHWTARRALLRGRFPYAEYGLFDRTHLRFFTRGSAHELARTAGYGVAHETFTTGPLPYEYVLNRMLGRADDDPVAPVAAVRGALSRRWPELFALQLVLVLSPLGALA